MQIEKQKICLPTINYDHVVDDNRINKHGLILGGDSKRVLVVGPKNCGKTNILLSLFLHPNGSAAVYIIALYHELPRLYIKEGIRDTDQQFDHRFCVYHDLESEKFSV